MDKSDGSISIHGVRIDRVTLSGAAERITEILRNNNTDGPFTVFTPNAEIIYRCANDSRLSSLINSGSLNIPDGSGTVWAARRLGTPLPGRVPGIELAGKVLENCAAAGVRIYLLGGKSGVAETASLRLAARFPGLLICGTHHGYFSTSGAENAEVIESINAATPALLIVCLGFPRQEEWITANRASLPCVRVMMALGGSLDVWSGTVRRAPALFRKAGLEWLWRIAKNPTRLKRAAALPAFVILTLREKRHNNKFTVNS